jgi:hypothetical protein
MAPAMTAQLSPDHERVVARFKFMVVFILNNRLRVSARVVPPNAAA